MGDAIHGSATAHEATNKHTIAATQDNTTATPHDNAATHTSTASHVTTAATQENFATMTNDNAAVLNSTATHVAPTTYGSSETSSHGPASIDSNVFSCLDKAHDVQLISFSALNGSEPPQLEHSATTEHAHSAAPLERAHSCGSSVEKPERHRRFLDCACRKRRAHDVPRITVTPAEEDKSSCCLIRYKSHHARPSSCNLL